MRLISLHFYRNQFNVFIFLTFTADESARKASQKDDRL